jgi:hypothetical protein
MGGERAMLKLIKFWITRQHIGATEIMSQLNQLPTILKYLESVSGCKIFQHSESYYSFSIACFAEGEIYPRHKFIVRKYHESELIPAVADRINDYDRQQHPTWEVIKSGQITT